MHMFRNYKIPYITYAVTYTPMTRLPYISGGTADFGTFINALITLTIVAAAIFAVFQITLIGLTYILSEASPLKRKELKDKLVSVSVGVLLVASTYIILNTINPNLLKLDVFSNVSSLKPNPIPTAPQTIYAKQSTAIDCKELQNLVGNEVNMLGIGGHCAENLPMQYATEYSGVYKTSSDFVREQYKLEQSMKTEYWYNTNTGGEGGGGGDGGQ